MNLIEINEVNILFVFNINFKIFSLLRTGSSLTLFCLLKKKQLSF